MQSNPMSEEKKELMVYDLYASRRVLEYFIGAVTDKLTGAMYQIALDKINELIAKIEDGTLKTTLVNSKEQKNARQINE